MPSGAKKRKAAKKKALSLLRSHDIVSAQEVTTADTKSVIMATEDDSCTHEDIMNTMKSRHLQTDVDVSHMGAAPHSSMNEDIVDPMEVSHEQTDGARIHMETIPSTSEGFISNAELHPDGAEVDHDKKIMSTNASVQENAKSLEQSTRRHQDVADDRTLATRGSSRDDDTLLELRSESASDIALPISSNGDSHEDIGQCVSCLQLCNDQCAKLLHISMIFATDMEHAHNEHSESVDKEDCNSPCHCVDNNPPSNLPTATTLHEEDCIVKQLVLTQSSSANKNHADGEKNIQELSLATGWWGCCGIFDWLLGKS